MLSPVKQLSHSQSKQLNLLRECIKNFKSVCVAYSGGVDSSLIAAIAQEQLGSKALAITGVSPSLSPHLLKEAREQALWLGIRHEECFTNELQEASYVNNPKDRCFTCKRELHKNLYAIACKNKNKQIIDGVNFDDLDDYRPGIQAAKQAGVRSPLAELKINKITVREISKFIGLPWWNKPAQPCLASRFPYGEVISEERLRKVDKAEQWLRSHGFREVRVRSKGVKAKIEVGSEQIQSLKNQTFQKNVIDYFQSIGFDSVEIDYEGYVSGKLNRNIDLL